jgi:hypothetical protein
MLERTSRFILEVFLYLSAAVIAAVIVPGYLYSQVHGFRAAATPTFPTGNENAVEIIHWDHAAFAPLQDGGTRVSSANTPPR